MKYVLPILLITIFFVLPACGPKIYEAPGMAEAVRSHQLIAILPPAVAIRSRPDDEPERLARAVRENTYTFQREIYSWILLRKTQGKIRNLEIMGPETTNARLERAGYTLDERDLTPAELCTALGVDAVVSTRFNMSKPMSRGAAVALGVLGGVSGTTNAITVNMGVHDAQRGLIWNYDYEAGGTVLNKSEDLIEALMRNASKRMPYTVN